jgi:hypothetical protein
VDLFTNEEGLIRSIFGFCVYPCLSILCLFILSFLIGIDFWITLILSRRFYYDIAVLHLLLYFYVILLIHLFNRHSMTNRKHFIFNT